MRTKYLVDGEEVGWRFWIPDGELGMEWEMRNGKRHGRYRAWNDGRLDEESYYLDDKEHGEHKQYDANGNHIGSYIMDHRPNLPTLPFRAILFVFGLKSEEHIGVACSPLCF